MLWIIKNALNDLLIEELLTSHLSDHQNVLYTLDLQYLVLVHILEGCHIGNSGVRLEPLQWQMVVLCWYTLDDNIRL